MAKQKRGGKPSERKGKSGGPKKKTGPKDGAFRQFYSKSNPRAEKKNDRRREKLLLEELKKAKKYENVEGPMRLNRYISLAGVCSRREADVLIANGKVSVNGKTCKELGTKVTPGQDQVVYNKKPLEIQTFVYLLMNKQKNLITTTKDDQGRATVMHTVQKYTQVRVYPVGRLDRNTTGLLLFTNDGDLAKRLTHPSHKVKKLYHVRLDKPFTDEDLVQMRKGLTLEDGEIRPDKVDFVTDAPENEVGVELHSGRNRIVRRMFEHLGYKVIALDRVKFGPLTKKNLPRGTCRFLEGKEIGFLKMM
ncbi:MAG: pseudouridine synthase [Bacteroidota bacterium]